MQQLTLDATMESLGAVARFVHDLTATARLTDDQSYKLRLATEEIATNIVTHGYLESGADLDGAATFAVEGAADADRVWIRLVDKAPEFDPTAAAEPGDLTRPLSERRVGGLGIHLARSVLDDFRYERVSGENRTTLVLKRTPGPAA